MSANYSLRESLTGEYREIYDNLIMPVDNNISLDSVILSDVNKHKIEEFLKENEFKYKFLEYGLEPMNRLLFYGASGCGKTYLAKALSNHLGYHMLYVDISKSLSEGSTARNISDIFRLANHIGTCIIFFDECDSIAWSRDSNNSESGDVRRATNSLFQNLDQMNPSNIFISATNMLHRLDPAFERRFNMHLLFESPNINVKEAIYKFKFDAFEIADDVNPAIRDIVDRRLKISFYAIQVVVERAMKKAVMNNTNVLKTSEIYRDLAEAGRIKINYVPEADNKPIFQPE